MTLDVPVAGAFAAGLPSFVSPWVLPLGPPRLCFLAGISCGELSKSLTGVAGRAETDREGFVGLGSGNRPARHVNAALSDEQSHGEVGPKPNGVANRYEPAQPSAINAQPFEICGSSCRH